MSRRSSLEPIREQLVVRLRRESMTEIARSLGLHESTVRRWVVRHNLPRRRRGGNAWGPTGVPPHHPWRKLFIFQTKRKKAT